MEAESDLAGSALPPPVKTIYTKSWLAAQALEPDYLCSKPSHARISCVTLDQLLDSSVLVFSSAKWRLMVTVVLVFAWEGCAGDESAEVVWHP